MTGRRSEKYWDARARENAMWFVDSRVDYASPDSEEFWRGGEDSVDRMLATVDGSVGPGDVVLDIGCGLGRLTRALADRCSRAIGIDVSREMLSQARELNEGIANVEWVHGDGEGLGAIADASVDGCFSLVVFQHIPDPQITLAYIRDMGRVLRPDGWAIYHVSTQPTVHEQRPTAKQKAKALLGRGPRGLADPAWLGSSVTVEQIERVTGEAGMTVERIENPGEQFTIVRSRRP